MAKEISRRCFLGTTTVGAASLGAAGAIGATPATVQPLPAAIGKTKVRIGKIYLGHLHPGWPMATVDLAAEVKRFEGQLAKLKPALADIEFVEGGLIANHEQFNKVKEQFNGVDGILVIQLTLGVGYYLKNLLELNIPTVLFSMPYAGHEWHTIASLQRLGKPIDCVATSDYRDLATAIRPFRAIRRMKDSKILYLSRVKEDEYIKAIREKFGTEIEPIEYEELIAVNKAVKEADAVADAEQWIKNAKKIVEPTREEIIKSSRMYLAMKNLLEKHKAVTITIDCLALGMIKRGLGYPCLGFCKLSNMGLGGICEADLKSAMTHLIFQNLVGVPGFITDPVIDMSNGTIIHAHCVAPTHMDGPAGPAAPYEIRSHLEDDRGASLRVIMRVGQDISMARLIGNDKMLFSTGKIVDTPDVERGCRTKITTKVENPEKFLENWSCGLHRVVFYGDHGRDIERYCRFMNIRVLHEGVDDLHDVPGLEWEPRVHR